MKNTQGIKGAKRLLACQASVTLAIALLVLIIAGRTAALSAVLGGLVSIVPNGYFAWRVFRYQGAKAAKKIVNSLYKGEAVKILLTLFLFALVFMFFQVQPIIFFVTYILVQMVFWFAPVIFK